MSGVAALVLAAGRGRRFGADKRLARLEDGRTLLAATLALAGEAFDEVWVVLRAEDPPTLAAGCRVVRCADADAGMGHSLAAGGRAVAQGSTVEALAVLLGDMPWISPHSLRLLQTRSDARSILLPEYRGQRGHPVIFGRRFWPALANCRGDQGARGLLLQEASACRILPVDDPGVVRDVDHRADLLRG
ncbi:nucleotidyltransferase family protein [Phytopseudomonas daroniae]|uniref:nucleotidyltransferase family protein n=1 Tax=Phytopseudomonas daroniae TaxID=2487519 RepID=UPI001038326E|nr:nucleotidyltransferase family protein [Pseudomonas daroniae]TBU78424.1 hypothetical protein DNK10_01410 [Pseudomonas daroniae]